MSLPAELFPVSRIRQFEAGATAAGGQGYALMCRAGSAAFACLRRLWSDAQRLVIVAGPGNNGGDGLVVARLAQQEGLAVTVMMCGDASTLRGEAAQAHADLVSAGGELRAFHAGELRNADVVVDALLGIGARAPLRDDLQSIIHVVNSCGRPVFALDIPSGLDPDTGCALPAVRANATVTFIALKQGLYLGDGPDHAGAVYLETLGVDTTSPPALRRLTERMFRDALVPRARNSHKSQFGRVVIIGGGAGMPGAVRLAGEAALRVGAGLVTIASLPEHLSVVGERPELMFHALHAARDVEAVAERADVLVMGPGLGRSDWARTMLDAAFNARRGDQRMVVDADALNLVAEGCGVAHCGDWVLTPHPGEAARLLGLSTAAIQQDRLAALASLCARRGGTIVLKGAATLVGHNDEIPCLCDRGNPGMAVPGMGDVLTGAIAGLLAQGAKPFQAAGAGVLAHAMAGDLCARQGIRGVMALEVATALRTVLAGFP